MALQKTIELQNGLIVQDAYNKVVNVGLIGKDRLRFDVTSHVASDKNAFSSKGYDCSYKLEGQNPIKQAYEFIKSLPEFAGSVDC